MNRLRAPTLALGALLAVAACDNGGTVTAPENFTEQLDAAVAVVAADAALEDLTAMNDMMPVGAFAAPGMRGGPGGMGMGVRDNLVRERSVAFFDAQDNEQDDYDALLTASIHYTMSMEGAISRDGFEASLSRSRDMWVTGLAGTETTRTFNGTGTESHSSTRVIDDLGTRTFSMEGTATISDVVRAVDRNAQPWPLSGTITRHLVVTIGNGPNGDETRDRTVTITFDGTQYARLVVDGEEYEVDLAAQPNDRPVRHRGGATG